MPTMNPVVHFEMPAENRKRMSEFYSKAFGWQTQQLGPEMGNYIVVTTSETGANGFPEQPGTINGGFYQKTEDPISNHPSIDIGTDDITDSIQKVTDAGGKILGEAYEIPGIGHYVSFIDTEGNRASILQPAGKI